MRIISVISTKGGVGKTTIAINLALALQNFNRKTAILDFNFTSPHVALYLNSINFTKTLNNFLKNECGFKEVIYMHPSGLTIVPTSLRTEDVVAVQDNLRQIIMENLKDYEFVIIDSAPGLGREAMISLNSCQEAIFVANPDLASIFDVAKTYKLINSLPERPIVWGIILNKVRQKSYELSKEDVERYTGLSVLSTIKENSKFVESLNKRTPAYLFDKRIREDFNFLAAKIAGIPYEKETMMRKLLRIFRLRK